MAVEGMAMDHALQKVESVLARISSSSIQQAAFSLDLDHDIGVSIDLQRFKDILLSFKDNHTLLKFDLGALDNAVIYRYTLKWVTKTKRVLDDAENMLDVLQSLSLSQKQKQRLLIKALINKVGHFFSSSSSSSRALATQIKLITHTFQRFASVEPYPYPTRFAHLYGESDVVIGREIDQEIVIEKLLSMRRQDDDETSLRVVLPIVGMRGLGKSTLAKIVLRDKRIRESFSVRIWVRVSPSSNKEKVDFQIINHSSSFDTATIYQSTLIQLQDLKIRLEGITVLGVLDDVKVHRHELRYFFQIGTNESKFLLITCNHSIASELGTIPSHILQPLSLKDSLSLFEKLAIEAKAYNYPELMEVGKDIVNGCEGIPLIIKAMGSELFSPRWMVKWESARHNDFGDLPTSYGILPALRLKYNYMPLHLKRCFQLFSLYPNDFVFHSSEIVSLWAALDLFPSSNINENLIDVSYQCLQKIIPKFFLRNFVNLGTSYYFQIHNVLLDIARDMATFECLMVNSNIKYKSQPQVVQHLSCVIDNLFETLKSVNANVRTILFPIEGVGATSEHFLNTCLSRYRHLRILDLSDSTYAVLPCSIEKLRYLRFLSLERNEKIKRVPDSICKLQHLQVLNLAGCKELKALPRGLGNLATLRQLGITTKESILPGNDIAYLDVLEFLRIESCDNLKSFFVGIKLPSLKTLEVTNCRNIKYLTLDIDHFPQLETLLVDNCDYLELIKGYDDQIFNLQLKAIHLHSLPQLVNLPPWLQKSTNTLQSLLIIDCKYLEMLPEWLSTFSVLGSFCIVNCPKLMSLPNDTNWLVALEYLRIDDCPELCKKCQPQDGEYWSKISHIKQIFIGKPQDLIEEEE